MVKTKEIKAEPVRKRPPAKTPEAQEKIMISLAMDQAEKQLREGTASSQVITHFLKLGSTSEKLENEIKEIQKDYIKGKTEALESSKRIEELYVNALKAMQSYSGNKKDIDDD